MSWAYLSLGSNVDAEHHIRAAVCALEETFAQCRLSPIYRSRAVGFSGDDFVNLVACVRTGLSPEELRCYLRDLEDRHGRDRNGPKFSDRTLDIDILLYDDLVLSGPGLQLPRPEIMKFAHVLKPLADLAPGLRHPVEHKTMSELWATAGLQEVELEEIELEPGER
jgi:2-amino-4-hydroxy-6-hydroxymethyldihydropteridine diphosphokinase